MDSERAFEVARTSGLLCPGRRVLVLLSGGRDSVCMLDVAVRLGCSVEALHVNYALRDEAPDDEAHCAALCERLGVALAVERPRRPEGNLQAWARDVRYGAAARRALARGALVATGHTASDQAETVLYRLAASPGRRALLGMPARDGMLVRPLLAATREDTAAYCRARGLAWREDASNASPVFARNRVRHDLLAALRSLHPAAERNVVRTAQLLAEEAAVLDELVREVLTDEVAALAALPPALRRLAVRRLAEDAAGRFAPDAGERAEEILALGHRPGSGALDLAGGLRAHVEYGTLRFAPAAGAAAEAVHLRVPGRVRFGGLEVACDRVPARPGEGVLDAAALAPELVVRPWRAGDRMRPLGLGGSKSLQDLFTDRRVPRARRGELPVVVSGSEIAWVPGVASAERFRIHAGTEHAVRLTARAVA